MARGDFGRWLKTQRDERGWSQDELAFRSHVSPRLIGRYERGEGTPSDESIGKLCAALEVPLPWVIDSAESTTARYVSQSAWGTRVPTRELARSALG